MTCLKDYLHYRDEQVTLLLGDALAVAAEMADDSVDCIVTSPPYFGLRDYGTEGQYGLESSPAEYVETMRALFSELRRVLADDGTLWLNIGDSYSGSEKGPVGVSAMVPNHAAAVGGKPYLGIPGKNLIGIPWRVAFALQDDGWILRNAIIWQKPNAMPESVTDRLSNRYEPVFMFSKSRRYWFDLDPIREPLQASSLARYAAGPVKIARLTPEEDRPANAYVPRSHSFNRGTKEADVPGQAYRQHRDREDPDPDHLGGRNPGDVWSIPMAPFPGAHFAVFPVALPQRCILAGCKPGGTVLDPFNGSGTTGLAAQRLGRKYVGIDVNAEYLDLSLRTRLHDAALDFNEVAP